MKVTIKTILLKTKFTIKRIWHWVIRFSPLLISLLLFALISWTLFYRGILNNGYYKILKSNRTNIITISGILSGIIIAYLTSKVLQIRSEKIAHLPELKDLTQKIHKFRAIVNKLIHSNMWVDGMSSFVNHKYKDLTFFDVREIVFVNGKVKQKASEFVSDHEMGDTANLYLELKSFLFDEIPFDDTLYSEFEVPLYYSTKILEKWIKYDCSNGLWYYFNYKYGSYEGDLNLNNVHIGYQEDIKDYSLQIDKDRYKDDVFGPELLAKLGTQFNSDIIPRLYRLQVSMEKDLPRIINYLYLILSILIVFGITLPILSETFNLAPIFDIGSIAMIISVSFYIVISFYGFLKNEIKL